MAPRAAAGGPALAQCRGCSQVLGWSVAAPGERAGGDGLVTLVARKAAVEGREGSALWCCSCGAAVGQVGATGEARVRPSEVRLVEAPWSCPCCGHGAAAVTAGAAGAAGAAPAAPVPSSAALRAMVEEAVSARLAGRQPPGPDAVSFEEIDKIKYVLLALNERVAQLMAVLVPDAAEEPAPPGSKRARKDARKDAASAGPAPAPAPVPAAGGPGVLKSESGGQQPQTGQPQPGSPRRKHVVDVRPPTPSSPSSLGMLTAASAAAAAAAAAASAAAEAPAAAEAAEPRNRSPAAKGPAHATRSPARAAAKGKEPPPRSPAKSARAGEPAKRLLRQTTQRALAAAAVSDTSESEGEEDRRPRGARRQPVPAPTSAAASRRP
jgi:ribonuclease E